jgi:hypothetical protein
VGADTATDAVNGFFNGLGNAIVDAMWPLAYMLIGSAVAAPGIASVVLVLLSSRWSLIRQSAIASVVVGAILTFFSFYLLLLFIAAFDKMGFFQREWVLVLPWLAGLVVLGTVFLHYQWRAGLDRARMAGIASCVLLMVCAVVTDHLSR